MDSVVKFRRLGSNSYNNYFLCYCLYCGSGIDIVICHDPCNSYTMHSLVYLLTLFDIMRVFIPSYLIWKGPLL